MLVRMWMTKTVKTVEPQMPILDALHLMKEQHFRRLPVVDKKGTLVGLVTESDIKTAAPSHKKGASVWEITEQMAHMIVEDVMTRAEDLITVSPDEPVEEVALQMRRNKVGSLLVLDDKKLIGIITESDVLEVLMELMGVQRGGTRLTLEILNRPGALTQALNILKQHDVNILSIVTCRHCSENPRHGVVVIRLDLADWHGILKSLKDEEIEVLDVREATKE